MQKQDPLITDPSAYELLDIAEDTRPEQITNVILGKALLKWGAKYTRQINEAYSKLRDPYKRLQLDFMLYRKERATRLRTNPEPAPEVKSSKEQTLNIPELLHYDTIHDRE